MQLGHIVDSTVNLLWEALPALVKLPNRRTEAAVERLAGESWPRVKMVWELVVTVLDHADVESLRHYLNRNQGVMARHVLHERLTHGLSQDQEAAARIERLLLSSDEAGARLYRRWQGPPPPPAYYLSLRVQGFRCFGLEQRLDLSDGQGRPSRWTVILGENGVGKTSLLQALLALSPVIGPVDSIDVGPGRTVTRYAGDILLREWIQSGLEHVGIPRRMELSTEVAVGSLLGPNPPRKTVSWGISMDKGLGMFGEESLDDVGGLTVFGYGATRRMGDAALTRTRRQYGSSHTMFYEGGTLANAEEWLLQADYAASKGKRGGVEARNLDEINRLLVKVLPDVTELRTVPGDDRDPARVEMKTSFGWVGLKQMSLGYRTLVAWMVDLASGMYERYSGETEPLSCPAVVLVDEIDLHLHPSWQRDLISLIGNVFPNVQFIATSHSPLIVQGDEHVNLALLRRVGGDVVIDNDVDEIRRWRVDQILTSELFGLDSARPTYITEKLDRREALLTKGALSAAELRELRDLDREASRLPTAESKADIEAMEIIRDAAEELRRRRR